MEYRRFENTVIVRMDRNEDLFAELKKVALKENIKLASISALGTFSHMNVGVYDLDQRKFVGNDFDGMFEIVSLTSPVPSIPWTGSITAICIRRPEIKTETCTAAI